MELLKDDLQLKFGSYYWLFFPKWDGGLGDVAYLDKTILKTTMTWN